MPEAASENDLIRRERGQRSGFSAANHMHLSGYLSELRFLRRKLIPGMSGGLCKLRLPCRKLVFGMSGDLRKLRFLCRKLVFGPVDHGDDGRLGPRAQWLAGRRRGRGVFVLVLAA